VSNRRQLSDEECRQSAGNWADELFTSGPSISVVVVEYNADQSGRRNKPSVVQAKREVITALQHGDIDAACAAIAKISHLPEPGLALCRDRETLAKVLAERLRRGEFSWDEGLRNKWAVTLLVWRE
jgi:hypothetical protein